MTLTRTVDTRVADHDGYDVAHSALLPGCCANDRARVVYPPGSKVSERDAMTVSDLHLLAEKDPHT